MKVKIQTYASENFDFVTKIKAGLIVYHIFTFSRHFPFIKHKRQVVKK